MVCTELVFISGEGTSRCSLNLSPNVLAQSPMYSSSQSYLLHLNQYITPLCCFIVSLSLCATKMFLNVLPLEISLYPIKYMQKVVSYSCFCKYNLILRDSDLQYILILFSFTYVISSKVVHYNIGSFSNNNVSSGFTCVYMSRSAILQPFVCT